MAQQPLVGQGFLIIETSLSRSDTPQSVGLLWTSDQSDAETCTWQHTTLTRDRHPGPRWDSKLQSRKASGSRPTPETEEDSQKVFFRTQLHLPATFKPRRRKGLRRTSKLCRTQMRWKSYCQCVELITNTREVTDSVRSTLYQNNFEIRLIFIYKPFTISNTGSFVVTSRRNNRPSPGR